MSRRLLIASFCLLSWQLLLGQKASAQTQSPAPLTLNQSLDMPLNGGQTQRYGITTSAGQFFRIQVEPTAVDVSLKLLAADGKELAEVDFAGFEGKETMVWLSESGGQHRLEVTNADKTTRGKARITLTALRSPTETDRACFTAQQEYLAAAKQAEDRSVDVKRAAGPQYEQAAQRWRDAGELSLAAAALYGAGDTQMRVGAYAKAIEAFNQALQIRQASNERREQAELLVAIGQCHYFLNRKDAALTPFQQALELRRALGDRDGEGSVLNNLGAAYSDLGDKQQAREVFEQAVPLRREPRAKAITLANLGRAYRDLGDKRKAIKTHEEALRIRRTLRDRAGEATSLTDLALVYSDIGEHQKALDLFAQALNLQRSATTLNLTGRAYYLLGVPNEALNYYEQALTAARTAKNRQVEADILNSMALAYWSSEEYAKALNTLAQTLPIAQELKARATEAAILNNYGRVYSSQGDQRRALSYYEQALPLLREVGNRNGEAALLNNLGFAYEAVGETDKARTSQQQALALSQEVADRRREARVRYGLARLESRSNRLPQAREQLEKTIKLTESQRAKLTSPELRAEFRASVQQYYDLYIDVLMRLGKRAPRSKFVAEALQVSEQARARSLLELLSESSADIRQGVDAALVERERALQEQLNDRTAEQIRLLGGRAKAEQVAALSKELAQLSTELRDVQTQIRQHSPRYAALTQPQPLTVRDLQSLLDAKTLLLEYALGEERSYLWVVSATSVQSFTLPKRALIEETARRFYESLTARNQPVSNESAEQKRNRIAQADAVSRQTGAQLSRWLLSPAGSLLGNKRLLIVSDGGLQYVPFAALPAPTAATSPSDKPLPALKPLLATHELVSLPSASTLATLRHEQAQRATAIAPARKTVAVFADPVFEAKDERVKTVSLKAPSAAATDKEKPVSTPTVPTEPSRLLLYKSAKDSGAADRELRIPRLPFTRKEAEAILALSEKDQSRAVFDFAANRAAISADDLGQYRLLHFATHGFLNSLNPELSGLVLALVDEQGKPQNGYLLAPEIYNLKLPATDLVVLSACQTGLGKEIRGEGMVGLTRGFMYAGAPRVVVSLWNVSDRATADLMKAFYQSLLVKSERPATALRSAQLQLLQQKQWQAPYFWAAFSLQGEWR